MKRQQKIAFVESFHETVKDASLIVVATFSGTGVNRLTALRRTLDPTGIRFRVVKNTLARRALEGTGREGLVEQLSGDTALFLCKDDPISGARVIRDVLKDLETLRIRGGYFDGDIYDTDGIKGVADLPSREDLLALLLGTLQEPARQVLSVLQAPARDLVTLLHNYVHKLSEAEDA
ncbi:MAG: 50S ribosomal protein L10 [Deltaproteobacteria bacterium]|nr:50S ribosomal protein L10 [Deltaproteobacteria bacterium]